MHAIASPSLARPHSLHAPRSFITEKFVASAGVRFGKYAVTTGNAHMSVEELRGGTVHLSARPSQARQTGSSEFPTAMLAGCLLTSGRWYYECRVQSDARGGVWQLGFFDTKFQGSTSDGVGVGDDKHSWAYDGARQCLWHGLHGSTDWGSDSGAPKGSVVGVAVDLDAKSLTFFIDGKPADAKTGVAFSQMEIAHGLTVRRRRVRVRLRVRLHSLVASRPPRSPPPYHAPPSFPSRASFSPPPPHGTFPPPLQPQPTTHKAWRDVPKPD